MTKLCRVCHRPIPYDAKYCPYCAFLVALTIGGNAPANAREESIRAGDRGVAAKHIKESIIQTGDHFYGHDDLMIVPGGTTRRTPVFPTRKDLLSRPACILSGYLSKMTKVLGFVIADMVEVGDYCLIEGPVIGIKGVQVGSHSSIEGFVMSPNKAMVGNSSAINGVFARWVVLEPNCTIRGNVFCEQLGDAAGNDVSLDGNCRIEGVLASSRSLIVGDDAHLGSIVCDASVTLGNNVEVSGIIQATGRVALGKHCTVAGGIIASCAEIGDSSRLGFIICSEAIQLGRSVEIDFLSAHEGINKMGARSRIGNLTLASPKLLPSMEFEYPISLSGITVSKSNSLDVSSKGIIDLQADRACGKLFTVLLTRDLYSLILSQGDLATLSLD